MSQITIVPIDQVVVLSGAAASGVDMASVDPEIHAVQFNTELGKGTVEFKTNPETGATRPQEQITNVDPWEPQILDAEEILFCRRNPKTFYSTVAPIGAPIEVTKKGWPQPDNSTEQAPPAQPSPNTSLYWDGTEFVWSAFPIDLDLAGAQNYVTSLVNDKAYALLLPSDWYVVRQSETGKAIPGEWVTWRAAVRAAASEKLTTAASQNSVESLRTYCQSESFQTW
jgi:hypothetical protein